MQHMPDLGAKLESSWMPAEGAEQPPVSDQITRMLGALESLGREVAVLGDRLAPILANQPGPAHSDSTVRATEPERGTSPLANTLQEMRRTVVNIEQEVQRLTHRVEL